MKYGRKITSVYLLLLFIVTQKWVSNYFFCWRDIEQHKENSRYCREVVEDDEQYFDLLERYPSVY